MKEQLEDYQEKQFHKLLVFNLGIKYTTKPGSGRGSI